MEFHVGDAQDLSFDDGGFDAAIMALVIHFVAEPTKALAEMARVVRPGGSVASYVWDYSIGGSPTAPLTAAMQVLKSYAGFWVTRAVRRRGLTVAV